MSNPAPQSPPAGFYDDGSGRERWFDGTQWSDHYQPAPQAAYVPSAQVFNRAPMTSAALTVRPEVSYTRPQKGHSIIKWIFPGIMLVGLPWIIYYTNSPNHYWHA